MWRLHQAQGSKSVVSRYPTIALPNSWGDFQRTSLSEEAKDEKVDDKYDDIDEDSYAGPDDDDTVMRTNSSMMFETVRMMPLF